MKKILIILMMAGTVILTGCSGKESSPKYERFKEPVYEWGNVSGKTISIWGVKSDMERPYIQKAFSRYEELTGNEIIEHKFTQSEFEAASVFAISNSTANAPDIMLRTGGITLEQYMPDKNFYNFSDAGWVKDLTSYAINQTVYNGRIIGLPHWEASILGTLYNKKIFEKYAITTPKTQQDFFNACEILLQNGITPVYFPFQDSEMFLYQMPLNTVLNSEDTLSSINLGSNSYSQISQMSTIIDWYKKMADRGYFGVDYKKQTRDGMDEALGSEKFAMAICWDTWLYTDFTGKASNFDIMPAFVGVPDEGCFEGPSLSLMIVNKNSKNIEAALDFITFAADPYNYNVAFEGIYTAPVFKNQAVSFMTPQYIREQQNIDQLYVDPVARLRLNGFSQSDALFIKKYIIGEISAEECLEKMDEARQQRLVP